VLQINLPAEPAAGALAGGGVGSWANEHERDRSQQHAELSTSPARSWTGGMLLLLLGNPDPGVGERK